MNVYSLAVGELATNCYIVADECGRAAVIDPGGEAINIRRVLDEQGLTLSAVLLTHVHFDHVGALDALTAASPVPVYCHGDEAAALTDGVRNLSAVFGAPLTVAVEATPVKEGDTVCVGSLTFTVLHTPGHTPGSVCYCIGDTLFSGDTLFCESIGRTDFPGGNMGEMVRSLRRLMTLPPEMTVYPGHDAATTIAHERTYNPYAGL